jgi:hypothetical protein
MPDPPFVKDLLKAEDEAVPDIEKTFLKSVQTTLTDTKWDEIEGLLSAQSEADQIVSHIEWDDFDPEKDIEKVFRLGLEIHGQYISDVLDSRLKFDIVDPKALEWIKQYGADEIKYISESQREAIKAIIHDGYEKGTTPQEQARLIREHIGLDPARSRTLEKYAENLYAKGKSEAEVWRLMEKKGKALLNARANTIAVNEASEAAGRATYESTKSACARDIIDANLYEGFRIVTADERTCTICYGVVGEARKLPDGTYPSSGSVIAKKHTKCRCVEGLREMKKQLNVKKRASGEGRANIIFDCQALKRKDGILYIPTVPMIEGVYEQWGFRVLRSYAEFSQSSHWLHGIPIVVNHEEVTPESRRIGQLFDVQNKPDGLKTAAISRFYEIDCTQRELETLLSGKPHDGSLRWSCFLEESPGEWADPVTGERKQYDYKEVGPYTFIEYSFVKQGVIGTNDGAGFNMQCKGCKSQSHSRSSAPGGADMEAEQIKEMIEEAVKPLKESNAALEQKNTALESEVKTLKESLATDRGARIFEQFQAKLKPGHQEKAKEYFEASQKDPLWITENADKFVQKGQERRLQGQANTTGGDVPGVTRPYTVEEMNAEQQKINKKVS